MVISDFAIRRPLITVVTMVALVVFGSFALWRLQTDEFPDVANPVVLTTIVYPGASPDQVEREVLDPIEERIQSISGVDRIMGEARDGYAQIITIFLYEKDLQEATQDIRDGIAAIRADLPTEMKEPILSRYDPADLPIVQLSLTSKTLSTTELTRIADPGITGAMRAIQGAANVSLVGNRERELTVELRPQALQATGVSVGEVVQALGAQNLTVPVGRLNGSIDERTIRLQGRLEGPEDFARMVVSERAGHLVRLSDVANVRDGMEEERSLALYNQQEAVGINITKAKGYSTTAVSKTIRDKVAEIQQTLPAGAKLEMVSDAGTRVGAAVKNVQVALLEGAFLTVLTVFLFLNSWRSTVITGLALPVSVLASFIAVWALGFKLETMSLLGLSLAIGILIDDAIVVRENIVRHVRHGKDHFTAAHEATDEIGLAVAATSFSIVSVFVPVAFMSGVAGQWFKPFALTIACSVLVSLFVSFSLDPMLSAYWPDPHRTPETSGWITRKLDVFNDWFNRRAEDYKHLVAWALDHRASMVIVAVGTFCSSFLLPVGGMLRFLIAVLGVALLTAGAAVPGWRMRGGVRVPAMGVALLVLGVVAFGAIGRVPVRRQVGIAFIPADDRSEFVIRVETPAGSNLDYTRLKLDEAVRRVRSHPEVQYTFTTLGDASGAVDQGRVYVHLIPKDTRSISADSLAQDMRVELQQIGGVTVSVFSNGFGDETKQIQLQLTGADATALNQAAEQILAQVKQVPNAVDVGLSSKGQKPELDVELHRGLAGSIGVSVGAVAQALRPAFAGIDAGDWVDPTGETRDVMVRLSPEARQRTADLEALPLVISAPGAPPTTIPLGQVATVTPSLGPALISHLNHERVVNVEANTSGRSLSEVTNDIMARVARLQLPPGVRLTQGGEVESQNEVFTSIFAALGIAVMLMYLILVTQFGSFLDPLAILLSLPLSLIGVFLALAVAGNTINLMSLIGVILLMGIVAKNAILLIDFAKWAREKGGMPLREALIEAGAIRLRPILMTTFALIAGMVPVALGHGEGAQFRAPLGIAVIGGVVTSTLLTLLVIPTFYEILDDARSGLSRMVGIRPAQVTAEHRVEVLSGQ